MTMMKEPEIENDLTIIDRGVGSGERPRMVTLTLDTALYQKFLDDSDLSDAQKKEFLETLWTIIVGFVDLGFGVHPLQQADADLGSDGCGQELDLSSLMASDVVSSKKALSKNQFAQAADRGKPDRAERKEI
ncbi:hypothetical protein B7H23_01245 [Notoacmeibacter marinus]|uniref:Uncharacterized protein n=1 Tax=Notoacmeibacter marinus TaxID=1876515 RepID=A0A231V086_9HYPH|nr:hypothetical protein [Notoacmeibacter marinus]OXT01625.1 hypothetical protein B7H23_01245 [Notoacmeibacter marinus]